MKLLNLQLLITLCITLINALNLNDIPIPVNNVHITDNGIGAPNVYINACSYYQERKRIYCTFKDKKYTDKGLYVMIPVEPLGVFKTDHVIKFWNVVSCVERVGCFNTDELGCMSLWETVEAGDTYTPFCGSAITQVNYFQAVLSDNSVINMKYNNIYVNEYK